MNTAISIIRAGPGDATVLTGIAIAAKRHWKYPELWIEIWLPLLTIGPDYISQNETWMAVKDAKPVGFYSLKHDQNELWLDNLWILPEAMGRGIGKLLFLHALEQSRRQQATVLKIEADPNAAAFYEKMGARETGELRSEMDERPRILPIMEVDL